VNDNRQLAAADEGKIDFLTLWWVAWAHRYLISIITVICTLVAVVLALTAVPVYRAEVVVTEVPRGNMDGAASLANQLGGLASLVGMNLGAAGGSSREAQGLLKSRMLVEEFVKRHGSLPELFQNPRRRPTLWFTVRKFKDSVLSIREDKRSGLTIVAINWTDPAVAARWANELVALANELLRTRAKDESKASITYLNREIEQTNVVELKRVMYNLIENEEKTLMLANARAEYAFRLVDPAVAPEERFSPRRTLIVLIGAALGMFIGTLAAFARKSWVEHRGAAVAPGRHGDVIRS
jgi:uncharacterized protein involved in exopolysaccharide biosynthesis